MLRVSKFLKFATNTVGNGLQLSLLSSHESFLTKFPIKSVTLPGSEGYFTVTQGHSPLLSTLKPGIISISAQDSNEVTKYFISSGFFVYRQSDNTNSAEVVGVEIVPLDHLDKERATSVLQEVLAESQNSSDPWAKVKSFLAQDLCSSIIKAVQ
ncbi:ATP synthase delta/epsilon chain, putative [Theileria equi strain WA]|uniref:ATP synthase delta/epsilon chain, putative n=1 Tax=Theileria equi strain WA TaxID=1537102 RepID=L0AVR2_THEEQ|nr:ATP synthase delta/epsilon chain, putative [Theileria equi strain WA]AFZ79116.1 ATP synthase delta/epsilon chain, putative [Theileria equi strain WA]|eukprot:XP_004828782.1 ATP synthase delta/epsilon chain, putative [Theileria equi strain WA]